LSSRGGLQADEGSAFFWAEAYAAGSRPIIQDSASLRPGLTAQPPRLRGVR